MCVCSQICVYPCTDTGSWYHLDTQRHTQSSFLVVMPPGHLCPYSCVLSDACVPHCSLFRLFPQQSPCLLITHLHHCIGIFQSSVPSSWPSFTLLRSLPGLTSSHASALSLLSLQGEPCLVPPLSCPVSVSAGVCEPNLRWKGGAGGCSASFPQGRTVYSGICSLSLHQSTDLLRTPAVCLAARPLC